MLALIAAQRDSQARVIAVLDSPLAHRMRDAQVIGGINSLLSVSFIAVRRIEEDSSNTELDRRRRPENPTPISTANPNAPQPI
jgi:hypothetical protein